MYAFEHCLEKSMAQTYFQMPFVFKLTITILWYNYISLDDNSLLVWVCVLHLYIIQFNTKLEMLPKSGGTCVCMTCINIGLGKTVCDVDHMSRSNNYYWQQYRCECNMQLLFGQDDKQIYFKQYQFLLILF